MRYKMNIILQVYVRLIRFFTIAAFFIIFLCLFIIPSFAEIKKNDTAPRIMLRDMQNKMIFISEEMKNKPILISFFFTACVPCKNELPELEKLYSIYNSNVSMYLISTDSAGAEVVKPFLDNLKISIPVLIDKYSDVARSFAIDKYPSMFLIGRNGKVVFSSYGYNEDNLKKLEDVLKKIK
jgi:peroxiredoxin